MGFVPAVGRGAAVLRARPPARFFAGTLPAGKPSFLGRPRGLFVGSVATATSSAAPSAILNILAVSAAIATIF
jgi:hypothetical protein